MEWTEERVETLKGLWKNGYTARQIAERLGGVTRNAVIGKAHRLGLSSRPQPVKREEAPIDFSKMARTCQWPIGHPGQDDFRFCGEAASPGKPYCNTHCAVAYRRSSSDDSAKASKQEADKEASTEAKKNVA